jgi:hypothetical protein
MPHYSYVANLTSWIALHGEVLLVGRKVVGSGRDEPVKTDQ